jgi:hypothetical protein
MIKPAMLSPQDEVNEFAHIFDAPLVTKGWTWLPVTQLVTWAIMFREAGRLHPNWKWHQRLGMATLTMPVILGSEWCHNLAHAAAAQWVGKPTDAIRLNWGMPLLVYYDTEDPGVTPRQHVVRALGGPLVNIFFWGFAAFFRRFTTSGTLAREVADIATNTNLFLIVAGMTPQPWFDGGTALKWALVTRGQTLAGADRTVRHVNSVAAAGMGIGAVVARNKRRPLLAAFLALMAALSLSVATGLFREKR